MRCEQAREALADARYAGGLSPALQAHLAACDACRALHERQGALDRWLALDEPAQPDPGFDARFFTALAREKGRTRKRSVARMAWLLVPAAAAVAAAAAALLLRQPATTPATTPSGLPADELALAIDLELVEEIEVVAKLEELEAYEVLNQIDEDELDRILQEETQ